MRIHTFAAAVALALPMAAIAQSITSPGTSTPPVTTSITGGLGSGTVSASGVVVNTDADRQLLSEIGNALASDPAAAGATINVQVVGGRVTLNGEARSQGQVESVKGIAQTIAGPANVVSNLTSGRQ